MFAAITFEVQASSWSNLKTKITPVLELCEE